MDHITILKKSWGLLDKILSGEKTIESRWYKTKHTPWNKIKIGDNIYFQNSGEAIFVKAKVTKVIQIADLTPPKTKQILAKYAKTDLGTKHMIPQLRKYTAGKNTVFWYSLIT